MFKAEDNDHTDNDTPEATGESSPLTRQRRWRLPIPPWALGLIALFFVLGSGLALWLSNRQPADRTDQALVDFIEFEEARSAEREVEVVLALQDPGDANWRQARAAQVEDGLANAVPVPALTPVQGGWGVSAVNALDDLTATADYSRSYTLGDQTLEFALTQFYRNEPDIGWVRTAPWPTYWEAVETWERGLLRIVYYAPDRALIEQIGPMVEARLADACVLWGRCLTSQYVNLFVTNDPLVLLDDPATNPRVIANLGELGGESLAGDLEYVWLPSPQLVGVPQSEAGLALMADYWAVRAIAMQAEQVSDEGHPAEALFTLATEDPALAAADPGISFEQPEVVVIEVTPPPSSTPPPSPTPEFPRYEVRQGDTLVGIAEYFGTTVELILAFNPVTRPESIYAGQVLIIPPADAVPPTATPVPTPVPTNTPLPTPTFTPTATPIPVGTIFNHTVASGETLVFIATYYRTTIDAIVQQNNLASPDAIFVGQALEVPYGLALTPVP